MVIGIGGTNGAGKDVVAELLVKEHGYKFIGATEMFATELKKRGWPADREHKSKLSAEWRREFGMGVVVDKALAIFEAEPAGKYKGLVVSSLRHPGEADRVHALQGIVLWVDADPEIRYQRIRQGNRGRELEDNKTFAEFLAEEQREMTPVGDAATLNTAAVKELADHTLHNNFTNLTELSQELTEILKNV